MSEFLPIAFLITPVFSYFAMKKYVAVSTYAREPGEADEHWLARQCDPSIAGMVAALFGPIGAALVVFSIHKWPRALGTTLAFWLGSVMAQSFIFGCLLVFNAFVHNMAGTSVHTSVIFAAAHL